MFFCDNHDDCGAHDMPLTTTLNRIREHRPCAEGWTKLLAGLGKTGPDDEPLSYATIARINGLDDALWCCQAEPRYNKHWRLFAVWCARQVEHLMTHQRSRDALDVAERHANGKATDAELAAAGVAARVAARAARAAERTSARDAAWAAWASAGDAAWAAAWAVGDVKWAPAMTVAQTAAMTAERDAQLAHFIEIAEAGDDAPRPIITKP